MNLIQQFVMIESSRLSKRDQKHSKILQKELEELHREAEAMNRRANRNDHQSQQQHEFVDIKGKKWWNRFSEKYFSKVHKQDYLQLRQITTTDRILSISPREPLCLSTYALERIHPEYDLFKQSHLIHIIYKSCSPPLYALTSYSLQQDYLHSPQLKQDLQDKGFPFTITPKTPLQHAEGIQLKQIKLQLAGINEDYAFCQMVEKYKRTINLFPDKSEVDREILLWQQQLDAINRQNNKVWQNVIASIKRQREVIVVDQDELGKIKDYLMWVTILKYFEQGHHDKTMQMLQALIENERLLKPAKSNDSSKKKFFQTDCKICFCSFNNDSNQVLYCDSCNTSFHLACYGLKEIPKEEVYYCDCCRHQKRYNYKKVMCALCNRTKFPIKELNGHFYHVTCLILLNLVHIKSGALVLKNNKDHQQIMSLVVQNEISKRECQFCNWTELGIRLQCSLCLNCAHPICAYINGCKYSVKRSENNEHLEVKYTCNHHDSGRDWVEQTYIRRYMCNLKETSSKNLQQFRKQYQFEVIKREQRLVSRLWDVGRVIGKTKFLQRMLRRQQTKSYKSQKVSTQAGRFLEKYKKAK